MSTTPDDRQILRDWLETHDNIDFGRVGKHPRYEQHAVQVIRSWRGLEQLAEKRKATT